MEKVIVATEQNKAIVRRFVEALGTHDEATLKALLSADFVARNPYGPQNGEVFIEHIITFFRAFSDSHFTVKAQVAEADTVVTEATWHAVHSGNFQGTSPTGQQIEISAILIEHVKDGKIVEHRDLFDRLRMMQQLGLIPPPQAAK